MRNFIALLLFVAILAPSCLFSEKNLFEQSSAERLNAQTEKVANTLVAAPQGWRMSYYPGIQNGGFNIFMKFDEKNVTMSTEISAGNLVAGKTATSLYTLKNGQGPLLTFDAMNPIMHSFCQPYSYEDSGFEGDHEFVVTSVTDTLITLIGRKSDRMMYLTALPENTNMDAALKQIMTMARATPYYTATMHLQGNPKPALSLYKTDLARTYYTTTKDQVTEIETVNVYEFIYTDKGLSFRDTVDVYGFPAQNFEWKPAENIYRCIDEGSNGVFLQPYKPANWQPRDAFVKQTFTFLGEDITLLHTPYEVTGDSNLLYARVKLVSTMDTCNVQFYYNPVTGLLDLPTGYVMYEGKHKKDGKEQQAQALFVPLDAAGNIYWNEEFSGKLLSPNPLRIQFKPSRSSISQLVIASVIDNNLYDESSKNVSALTMSKKTTK